MEQASRDAFSPRAKADIFRRLALLEAEWQDLGGFESFVFAHQTRPEILRITHVSHRSASDIAAELEFLNYLGANSAAVCAPLPLLAESGEQIIEHDGFICCLFERAEGKQITEADWAPRVLQSWGAAMGRFHRLSRDYQPVGQKRFAWQEDANLHFRAMIPGEQAQLLALGDDYLAELEALSTCSDVYGLIHSDAHAGNFFLHNGQLKFFDFDDCCYQWYAFDVATILFSAVLQPWMPDGQAEREAIANAFLPEFLTGYGREFTVSEFLLEQLPLFLKLREFSLYGVIHSHMDVDHLEDWYPIKFMQGRRERMEADLPYFDLDFTHLRG
ncbi:MAG: phosphotransferase enzyme family protein [Pseudomonadales bacterium]